MAEPDNVESESIPDAVAQNIATIRQWKTDRRSRQTASDKIADAISGFAGSMPFVYIHLALFGFWIIANVSRIPGVPQWDPSLVILAMAASVEAIFLSTFVLIKQNRMTAEADQRAELDLQVSLLNERETTRLITMTQAIAEHLGITTGVEQDLGELRRDTQPDVILDAVNQERTERGD
jgi:uncharacterized membrane protein